MAYGRAAVRYAKSVLELAIEQGSLDTIKADMDLIQSVCTDSKELLLMLKSPIVNSDKKLSVLTAVFGSKVSDLTNMFIKLLIDKGREAHLSDIATAFDDLYLEHNNTVRAVIKSVSGVNDTVKATITQLVKSAFGKDILIVEEIDTTLIGGFVLTVGDQQVDASISRKLADLEKEFSKNTYVKEY